MREGTWGSLHIYTDGSVKHGDDEIAAWAFAIRRKDSTGFSYAGRFSGRVARTCRSVPNHALTSTDS
eukprot:1952802-Pyramimonas_sp.AAC.1